MLADKFGFLRNVARMLAFLLVLESFLFIKASAIPDLSVVEVSVRP
jgi:hypothetical protein